MSEVSLREQLKELPCRHCDGISGADPCELNKSECPVLKDAPDQILRLVVEAVEGMPEPKCQYKIDTHVVVWNVACQAYNTAIVSFLGRTKE